MQSVPVLFLLHTDICVDIAHLFIAGAYTEEDDKEGEAPVIEEVVELDEDDDERTFIGARFDDDGIVEERTTGCLLVSGGSLNLAVALIGRFRFIPVFVCGLFAERGRAPCLASSKSMVLVCNFSDLC